ncbi:ATP-grasp domain-containing protein [Cryobacterium melibiosiphilum]|uniref:biotin carboxylase n=1 Tax=Cryobacterium melibiosiphilum TaxID=995039 RepID=A0A3A5MMR7_9MICO|nr:biotin carboxylase N-terminal domain-containing protein [Cryobacterium melibiosiphilum]RJT87326.1 ATP-grasp domain-containing protein [Cryobacterium melibiosiphilum]
MTDTSPQPRPFRTVLVANRGEIACRILRTLRASGIRSVAVYSDADRGARHVQLADVAVRLAPRAAGAATGAATDAGGYLSMAAILAAAAQTGAEAIHPGYGFLSENRGFAEACADAGVVFIGPSVHALTVMGDKIRSKNHVATFGVPVIPGVSEPGLSDDELITAATDVGYPLLIKPSAGGGGKGMQVVDEPAELADALATARRVALAAFGDDTLLLERLVPTPRHIEVQILADSHGHVIHLGERECSLQRRHQKVIEEAPSPLLTAEVRARIGEAACAAARSVDYSGAGTVEFLVSNAAPDQFFFMEMNTRLQVEHPVTELVTGVDLVDWQLRVAAGEHLTLAQADVTLTGHAIEARVYAENPGRGFLPSEGTVRALIEPAGPGIRVDSSLAPGLVIGSHYDPMLAKVVAWGADRAEALARLDRALADTVVLGVQTNVEYLRLLLAEPEVQAGRLDTGLIERSLPGMRFRTVDEPLLAAAALVLHARARAEAPARGAGPWAAANGWRLGPDRPTQYSLATSATDTTLVSILGEPGGASVGACVVRIGDGPAVEASLTPVAGCPNAVSVEYRGITRVVDVVVVPQPGGDVILHLGEAGVTITLVQRSRARQLADELDRRTRPAGQVSPDVRSPMPGTVVAVHVATGDRVEAGQLLLTVEAMKMEHKLTATTAGIVRITLQAGGLVTLDQVVASIEPEPEPEPDPARTVKGDPE